MDRSTRRRGYTPRDLSGFVIPRDPGGTEVDSDRSVPASLADVADCGRNPPGVDGVNVRPRGNYLVNSVEYVGAKASFGGR